MCAIGFTFNVPHAEDSSQPPPITGDKREATDHTEQGEISVVALVVYIECLHSCSSPQETSVMRSSEGHNNKTLYIAWSAYFYIEHTKNLFHVEILMDIISYSINA